MVSKNEEPARWAPILVLKKKVFRIGTGDRGTVHIRKNGQKLVGFPFLFFSFHLSFSVLEPFSSCEFLCFFGFSNVDRLLFFFMLCVKIKYTTKRKKKIKFSG